MHLRSSYFMTPHSATTTEIKTMGEYMMGGKKSRSTYDRHLLNTNGMQLLCTSVWFWYKRQPTRTTRQLIPSRESANAEYHTDVASRTCASFRTMSRPKRGSDAPSLIFRILMNIFVRSFRVSGFSGHHGR